VGDDKEKLEGQNIIKKLARFIRRYLGGGGEEEKDNHSTGPFSGLSRGRCGGLLCQDKDREA